MPRRKRRTFTAEEKAAVVRLVKSTDRGCQYASAAYQAALHQASLVCSMSRKGDCWDNAVAESFFGTLKIEQVHRSSWSTRLEARSDLYVRHLRLGADRQGTVAIPLGVSRRSPPGE